MGDTESNERWAWLKVVVDGDDLVVRGTRATNFGHKADTEDNGVGSGGWPVADHPGVPVVALPYRVAKHRQFKDSPIPRLPVKSKTKPGARVRVFCPATGRVVEAELADLGPSLYIDSDEGRRFLHTGIDLSEATVKALGLTLAQGEYKVDYRIIDGAKSL